LAFSKPLTTLSKAGWNADTHVTLRFPEGVPEAPVLAAAVAESEVDVAAFEADELELELPHAVTHTAKSAQARTKVARLAADRGRGCAPALALLVNDRLTVLLLISSPPTSRTTSRFAYWELTKRHRSDGGSALHGAPA
jgi:hypothetical protein